MPASDRLRQLAYSKHNAVGLAWPIIQYHVSGVLRIKMDDGSEFDCKPGDVSLLPSGHDAWVNGDEPAVVVDFQGMLDYATGGHAHAG